MNAMNFFSTDIKDIINRVLGHKERPKILEAGCGSLSHVTFPNNPFILGIDVSQEQLDRNGYLDKKILGDIQVAMLPNDTVDAIVCWDVVEHLPRPDEALSNFSNYLRPEGLLIVAAPNIYSLKGLLTKFTPHWFHIWVYRNVYGSMNAGKPGYGPFPTYMRRSISPASLKKFAQENNFHIEYFTEYESGMVGSLKDRSKFLFFLYRVSLSILKILSLGTFDAQYSDYIIVLRKAGANSSL